MSESKKNLITMRAILDGGLTRDERIMANIGKVFAASNLGQKFQDEILKYIGNLHRMLRTEQEQSIVLLQCLTSDDDMPDI